MRNEPTAKVRWGNVTRHPETSELGARAHVRVERDGWQAAYHVDTHGKSSSAVADEIDQLDAHHAEWSARQTMCGAALGVEFVIRGEVFRIVDFTIPVVQPGARPRVLVGVARINGARLQHVSGFPRTFRYETISDIPPNAAIISEVRAFLEARDEASVAHQTFIDKVQQKLDDAAARRDERRGG